MMFSNILCTLQRLKCKTVYYMQYAYSTQVPVIKEQSITKVVHVAIIGTPNSGKSTLINNILDRKICAASNKVHTTTKLIRAIGYENNTQIIFLDTPGIVTEKEQKKFNLPKSMIDACHKSLRCADVIGVVHDVSNRWSRHSLHQDVLQMLEIASKTPSFLILNKIDLLKSKRNLLEITRNLTNGCIAGKKIPCPKRNSEKPEKGYSNFSDVFLVSALEGDGVDKIKEYLLCNAKPAKLLFSTSEWTDQTSQSLIEETVRAKLLDFLPQEIPYQLNSKLEYLDETEDKIVCGACVECPTERLVRLISGAGGGRLQQIKDYIRSDLMHIFKKPVAFTLQLRAKDKQNSVAL